MALTALQRLRLKVADKPRQIINEEIGAGNSVLTTFQVQLWPILTGSDVIKLRTGVAEVLQVRDVDYIIDLDTGVITFTTTPLGGVVVIASYKWFAFTDAELEDLLTQVDNSVVRAAIEVIRWLLADTDRFIKYTFGQESVDRSASREGLKNLLEELKAQMGAPVGLVRADTDAREETMSPFIDQSQGLADDLA